MLFVVTGDRNWTDRQKVHDVFLCVKILFGGEKIILVHGKCRGLDRIAGEVGRELGFEIDPHPANWGRYKGGAGPIRNGEMLDRDPLFVLAFHNDLPNSKGTLDCVTQAIERQVPVFLHCSE